MPSIDKIVAKMLASVANVAYADLRKVCVHYFGEPRQEGTSHAVFNTGWQDAPILNIQSRKGQAKPYQVRQVLAAIDRLSNQNGDSDG